MFTGICFVSAGSLSVYLRPCGPDAPTLASSFAGSFPWGDGGNKARSPGRARSKPLKPLRGECRVIPAVPVVTNARAYYHYTRGYGCGGHPAFPAPSVFEGTLTQQLGRCVSRGCGGVSWLFEN